MKKLPIIQSELTEALNYFEPMAKSIHPQMELGDVLNKTVSLTEDWFKFEMSIAIKAFYLKRGVSVC